MKIAVIDDSRTYLKILEKMLKNAGFNNLALFSKEEDILEYLKNNKVHVVIIDYILKKIDGISLSKEIKKLAPNAVIIMLTSSKDEEVKKQALQEGIDEFINKDITFPEFVAKMKMINKLVSLLENERERRKKLRKELEYTRNQEKLAFIKYHKIVKNELSMFFEENKFFESFYKPRDVLNGDSIFTKRIDENRYILAIVDAMGKGLHAALTSVNVISFLEHSLQKAIEFNDFNFKKLVKDLLSYTKHILLDKEILCIGIVCIKKDKIYYANFGMPPMYTDNATFRANNPPITVRTTEFHIDEFVLPKFFYILSDGLLESPLKDKSSLYFKRLKSFFKENKFIKEIIEDFSENAIQSDDISIIHFFRDISMKTLLKFEYNIEKKDDINKVLLDLSKLEFSQKNIIMYIAQELLMNLITHALKGESIKLKIEFKEYRDYLVIIYKEDSKGFDINILHELELDKYHGRGIKIVKNLSDALFFSKKANQIIIFLKEKK